MFKVFIISVGIAFSIQIIHSILTKGGRFTLGFFGGGLLFGFLREIIYHLFNRVYDFPNMPIKLLNVPVFIPIGWVFTFYLAYEFTNKLIQPRTEKDYRDFVILVSFFSTFICIPIETAAMNMNWWVVFANINDNIAALGLMSGWFCTSVMFFCFYFYIKKKLPQGQLWLALLFTTFPFLGTSLLFYAMPIIVLIMLRLNKEITFIFLMYGVNDYCSTQFRSVPNGIFVTIAFIFTFAYILVKLYFRNTENHLSIKN